MSHEIAQEGHVGAVLKIEGNYILCNDPRGCKVFVVNHKTKTKKLLKVIPSATHEFINYYLKDNESFLAILNE